MNDETGALHYWNWSDVGKVSSYQLSASSKSAKSFTKAGFYPIDCCFAEDYFIV